MAVLAVESLLEGKDDPARSAIACRVGERLSAEALDEADRQAAEALARLLACDAVERVRAALAASVRHAKYLSREIALRIAHDVDSVACPFLEVTDAFSEADWQQLVLTISRSAMIAVARRASMPESLAVALAEIGPQPVAETLVGNPAAPMTQRVCTALIDRFQSVPAIMDEMAGREDLIAEIVVMLTAKASAAVRAKLLMRYKLPDHTEAVGAEAEMGALLAVIRHTAASAMPALVQALRREGKLSDFLLLKAAGENLIAFLAVAVADRAMLRPDQVKGVLMHGAGKAMAELLRQAGIAETLHQDFWTALSRARNKKEWTIH